ncbi:hypothetical protein ARALYDRAFT_897362 [Arabidopsis lyrata subsp. lyrata]|uniref:Uncharacterized protein n=1 Tax=Arabidopsis lyrata subsp. lyrata TaxID=81972 RepID=D7LAP6_ARALL|nr:uncharacterized protein LOC9318805 [Arabidopsis lyrata subsp. lyrata]EFH61112.1 hypothetical protein ARALYDRAFT_897362 [Arabidopsis lyrata subsp. lyrata]|eukprot:XP_002884853.1 uncharacterized protein LOC9318805 [Arabidopsis lyrata subsp. lyrata]
MVFFMSYPPTRRQLTVSVGFFAAGVSLFVAGAYLSLANIAPQQARVKARNDFVKDRIRKWLDD